MGYSQPQSSCHEEPKPHASCDEDRSCQPRDEDKSCQSSCDQDKSHSSCGGDSGSHWSGGGGGGGDVGVAQGTGVNEQHGFLNINALNGNNVLSNDLNGLHILTFG